MSDDPSDDRTDTEPVAEAAYDELADSYAEELEGNVYNAHLDFPGTTALVPDVDGQRVLDAGCGGGRYTEWLVDRGAEAVGIDVSRGMLAEARERVGDRAEFRRADLGEPLDFDDGAFDGVVSGLALGYVEDWRATFAEFARVLDDGGFLVFSVKHPFDDYPLDEDENYFHVERRVKEWSVDVPYYRRPVGEMLNPLLETGFRIDRVAEPQPTEAFILPAVTISRYSAPRSADILDGLTAGSIRRKRPERYEKESKRPVFLTVRAVSE